MKRLPSVLFRIIHEYLNETKEQAVTRHQRKQATINFYVNVASSRKNGFDGQEENETDHPQWIFYIPRFDQDIICSHYGYGYPNEISLQAVNCPICGGYHHCQRLSIPENIRCKCGFMFE
jgi:hypothetical protein